MRNVTSYEGSYIGEAGGGYVAPVGASSLPNSGVSAGTYGNASSVGVIQVDTKGLVTSAVNTPVLIAQTQVTGLVSDLAAKADLAGVNATTTAPTLPSPAVSFYVKGNGDAYLVAISSGTLPIPAFIGCGSGGTAASPTATPNGGMVAGMLARGHDGSAWGTVNRGLIAIYATELWTPTAQGCRVRIATTAIGTLTRVDRLIIDEFKVNATVPVQLPSYLVAALPVGSAGMTAFASNGRKVGETAGNGTGSIVVFSNGQWRRLSDETQIVA